jgi:hypothetical protein
MIMGDARDIEPHHVKNLISHQHFMVLAFVVVLCVFNSLNEPPKHKFHNMNLGILHLYSCVTYIDKNISQGQQIRAHYEHNKVVYWSSS